MAHVIHLSSQPLVLPQINSFKRLSNKLITSSSSTVLISTPLPLSPKTRKRAPFIKVHAVIAETADQPKWWERSPGPNMIDIHSTEEFLSALSDAGDKLVVAEFYGTWCASCRALFPRQLDSASASFRQSQVWDIRATVTRQSQLCRMAEEHPEILFLKVNFDENKAMCKSMNVKVLPFFHFYRGADGKVEGFSCSLAKFQKIKDAVEMYNPASSNNGEKVIKELQSESPSDVADKSTEPDNT